jgi:hypothetical protein
MKVLGLILLVLLGCTSCTTLTEAELIEHQLEAERLSQPVTVPIYVKQF